MEIDPKTIYKELVTTLEPSASSYTTVIRWAKRFRQGREDVNDHPRSASPLSEFTGENIQLVRQVVRVFLKQVFHMEYMGTFKLVFSITKKCSTFRR